MMQCHCCRTRLQRHNNEPSSVWLVFQWYIVVQRVQWAVYHNHRLTIFPIIDEIFNAARRHKTNELLLYDELGL